MQVCYLTIFINIHKIPQSIGYGVILRRNAKGNHQCMCGKMADIFLPKQDSRKSDGDVSELISNLNICTNIILFV